MSDDIYTTGTEGFKKVSEELKSRTDTKSLSYILRSVGMMMVRSVVKNFQVGGRPDKWPKSGAATQRDVVLKKKNKVTGVIEYRPVAGATMKKTGTLMKSISFVTEGDTVKIGMTGEAVKYGTMLNTGNNGKPIVPTKAKALTIPICKAAQGKTAAEIPGLFRIKNTLVRPKGKKKFEAMFALRKSVQPKAYPFLVIQDEDEGYINNYLTDWMINGQLP